MPSKALVIDANILVRAVLGQRVRRLLVTYCEDVSFYVPQAALSEAEEHLPALASRHGRGSAETLKLLRAVADLAEIVPPATYEEFEREARERLGSRDPDDLFSRLHCRSNVPSGPKTRISSAAAWRPGRQAAWNAISANSEVRSAVAACLRGPWA